MAADDRASLRTILGARNLRLLLGAHAISAVGQSLSSVALVVLVYEQTRSAGWVAAVTVLRLLPYVLFSSIGGVLADRFDRRSVMLVSDAVRASLLAALAMCAALAVSPFVTLGLAFAATAVGTLYYPAIAAMLPSLVRTRDLAAANAVMTTVESSAFIVGPAIGGLILVAASPAVALTLNAAAFVASFALVAAARPPRTAVEEGAARGGEVIGQLREGFREVLRTPGVSAIMGLIATVNLVYGVSLVLLVFVADELLQVGTDGYGLLNASLGIGALAAGAIAARLRPSAMGPALGVGLLCAALPFALLAPAPPALVAYALMLPAGGGSVLVEVLSLTILQRTLPERVLGRVIGLSDALAVGAILVGSVVTPLLVQQLGTIGALMVLGALVPLPAVGALATVIPLLRRSDAEAARLEPVVAQLERAAVFRAASRSVLERLAAAAAPISVPVAAAVVREGEVADALYVIVTGRAVVTASRSSQSVAELGPGDYFGEIGLLEETPRTATVTAETELRLYRIQGDTFLDIVTSAASLPRTLREGVGARLARTRAVAPHTPDERGV